MLKAALFSDGTKEYRIPEEPECGEQVTIRFRTGMWIMCMRWSGMP